MPHLPEGPDITPKYIWNPTTEDFTTTYADENNVPVEYTAPSLEMSRFPTYIARHIAKKLADVIVWKRGIKTNFEDDYKTVLKEILG